MHVLLVSTYELGHQPLHLASPAAALAASGHEVRCLDLSVEGWGGRAAELLPWADAAAFSVPMHTAMRLAVPAARALRDARPGVPICLYGLYAPVSRDLTVGTVAERVIAGEYEPALVAWVASLSGGGPGGDPVSIELGPRRDSTATRPARPLPARHLLPGLERYSHLDLGAGDHRRVGYVEASHGCSHRCRHCPVPVVYDGRSRAVEEEWLLADVAQLVGMGAEHITFGDPDFLNRPQHARRVAAAVHEAFPSLTFDVTVKVEHVLRHEGIWAELAAYGCLFVVSAFESVDDATLARLDKGHSAADAARAVAVLRAQGIEVRPSFLPFTPWTTLGQVLDLVDFVAAQDLVPNVDPVQYAIRLLLPEGSLLLERADIAPALDGYDAEALTWRWRSADPRVDALQQELSALAESAATAGELVEATYGKVRDTVARAAGWAPPSGGARPRAPAPGDRSRPRLTEPWFC